jgi:prepilin-type N-terminal cleavage/methylation domain-containing protein
VIHRTSPRGFTLIELLIVVAVIAIIAAIAVPALLRARIAANESAAIGDIRTVVSANASYYVANGGFYDSALSCLNGPVGCIPNYPTNAPNFLDSQLAHLLSKGGYSRSYAGGETPSPLSPLSSGSSVTSYVYWATPTGGAQTGVRGFAADSSGLICYSPTGTEAGTTGSVALDSPGVNCIILQQG